MQSVQLTKPIKCNRINFDATKKILTENISKHIVSRIKLRFACNWSSEFPSHSTVFLKSLEAFSLSTLRYGDYLKRMNTKERAGKTEDLNEEKYA